MLTLCETIRRANRKRKPAPITEIPAKKKSLAPPENVVPSNELAGDSVINESPKPSGVPAKGIAAQNFVSFPDEPLSDLNLSVRELSVVEDSDLDEVERLNKKSHEKNYTQL